MAVHTICVLDTIVVHQQDLSALTASLIQHAQDVSSRHALITLDPQGTASLHTRHSTLQVSTDTVRTAVWNSNTFSKNPVTFLWKKVHARFHDDVWLSSEQFVAKLQRIRPYDDSNTAKKRAKRVTGLALALAAAVASHQGLSLIHI